MKKEENTNTSHKGVLGWSLGLISLIFAIIQPVAGIIFSIVGFIVSYNQVGKYNDDFSKTGKVLSIISFIVSLVVIILTVVIVKYFAAYFAGLQTGLQ